MKKQINQIRATAYFVACIPSLAIDQHRYNKERKVRQAEREAYDAMIAESQTKIGPYVPQTCPVQIWA